MNNQQKYDIVSIVMNPVSRDARVLKQATSLHNAGYSILCIGTQTKDYPALIDHFGMVKIYRPSVAIVGAFLRHVAKLLALLILWLGFHFFTINQLFVMFIVIYVIVSSVEVSRKIRGFLRPKLTVNVDQGNDKPRRIAGFLKIFVRPKKKMLMMQLAIFLGVVSQRPKVLHCHDVTTLPIGMLYKMIFFNVHLVYDAHEIYEDLANKDEQKSNLYKSLHSKVQRKLSKFITINNSIAQWYAENYPELPRATIVKNATMRVKQVDYDGRLHNAAGLDRNTNILLYQGGFAKHRGLEWLVRAGALLPENWALVMMGWGNLESELRDLASEKHAIEKNKVCFIPPAPQSELAYWTQGASLGIIPYDEVGLNHKFCTPNKLWEYPNAGVPLIVSDLPEMKNTVDEFGVGWTLPQNRSDSDLFNLVLSLQEIDIQTRRDNCEIFMQEDGWHKYETRLLKCYEELIPREAADA